MASYFVSSASGAGGAGNGSSWANAYLTIVSAIARPLAAGDTLFIGDDHIEASVGQIIMNCTTATATAPISFLVVDHTKASPSIPADLRIGTTSGGYFSTNNGNIQFAGFLYVYGMYVNAGIASAAQNGIFVPNTSKSAILDNCTFVLSSTAVGCRVQSNTSSYVEYRNCTFIFNNNVNHAIASATAFTKYIGCTFTYLTTQPTYIVVAFSNSISVFEGCDFSAFTTSTLFQGIGQTGCRVTFKDCKLPTAPALDLSAMGIGQTCLVYIVNCDQGGVNYRNELYDSVGVQTTSVAMVRTGGASQGTPYSWKIVTNSTTNWLFNFKAMAISIWNALTGAAVNITIEGIADPRDFSALPKNDEVWFDVEALTTSGFALGITTFGTKTSPLATGSALTASTAAWDSAATARANSTAYVLGNIYKVASNPGRLFVCTTAGTSAGAEPGGLATAVDGGAVTDGTAIFTAMWRFKQTITTAAIQLAGFITVYPKVGKTSMTNGIYLDPFASLS